MLCREASSKEDVKLSLGGKPAFVEDCCSNSVVADEGRAKYTGGVRGLEDRPGIVESAELYPASAEKGRECATSCSRVCVGTEASEAE